MKVLYLGTKEWPCGSSKNYNIMGPVGIDNYVNNLIEKLKFDDLEVFVLTRRFPHQKKEEMLDGIRIKRYPFFGGSYSTLFTMFLFSFFYGISLVRKGKIDIIHGHGFFGILPAYLISKIIPTKVIGTSHGYYLRPPTISLFQHIMRTFLVVLMEIYFNLDKWIFLNDNELNNFVKIASKKPKNHIIIYNGIDIPKKIDRNRRVDNYILFVGRLVPAKSLDNLILAVSLLRDKEKISLNIVGDGSQMQYLRDFTIKNQMTDIVKFYGWQNDLKTFYQKAHVFVLPSYIEGGPSALYEAMSFGIPSVISNLDLAPDNSVLKCSANRPEIISQNISLILDNPEIYDKLSNSSRKVAEKYFNRDKMAKEHLKLYENLYNQIK